MLQQLSIARPRKLYVGTGGLLGTFLESVQYVDSLKEPNDVADPMFRLGVHSYLLDAHPYAAIGFQSFGSSPCWTRSN